MTTGSTKPSIEVRTERMATGGEAIGHLDDGRVVFVAGALPDESVRIELTQSKKRFARGHVIEIVQPSADRVEPPCTHARSGQCGGCDWMHTPLDVQRSFKEAIVVEQLTRLGKVQDPQVSSHVFARGRRTTVRCHVTNGSAGYRARRSDRSFTAVECGAVDERLEELVVHGGFGDATEVVLRLGSETGDRMVITDGSVDRLSLPSGVVRVAADDPGDAAIHEIIGGTSWRISANSFFQTSHAGAEALVAAVARSVEATEGSVVDLYAGVGLLGGATAADRIICSVESNPSSVADARHNLGPGVQVVQSRVERWTPVSCQTVIADPARRGLADEGVAIIGATGANHLVLVSCDPASLGRDAGLLAEQGWKHQRADVIDMFPDTSRIEVVSTFTR